MATQQTPDRFDRLVMGLYRAQGAQAPAFLIAHSVLIESSCPAEVPGINKFSLLKS